MLNAITKGTQAEINEQLITNEDFALVVEVDSCLAGIVTAHKIWDTAGTPTPFYAKLQFAGRTGTPPDTAILAGQHVIFYRVGDFNSAASAGYDYAQFEKHVENGQYVSFVCFVPAPLCFVEDLGDGTGKRVAFSSAGVKSIPADSVARTLVSANPATLFHESTIPWKDGRVYPAIEMAGCYVCFLQCPGQTFYDIRGANIPPPLIQITIDQAGKVKDFIASQSLCDIETVTNFTQTTTKRIMHTLLGNKELTWDNSGNLFGRWEGAIQFLVAPNSPYLEIFDSNAHYFADYRTTPLNACLGTYDFYFEIGNLSTLYGRPIEVTYKTGSTVTITTTASSEHLSSGATLLIKILDSPGGTVLFSYSGTYSNEHTLTCVLTGNAAGYWEIWSDGVRYSTNNFYANIII